ncbi:MAG: hypothetical protein R8G66_02800 [Cytophagales bacterium]|nr:hypothetical protein [Cytophagales bacterium]
MNEVVKRFEIIQSSGKRYGFSYSILPVCIQEDNSLLYLKAYELLITIKGRGLDAIRKSFSREELLWVRASHSGKDDGSSSTFIEEILVEGNAATESI